MIRNLRKQVYGFLLVVKFVVSNFQNMNMQFDNLVFYKVLSFLVILYENNYKVVKMVNKNDLFGDNEFLW